MLLHLISVILIFIAVTVIIMALFSNRVRKISEKIEDKKKRNSPWYARQRDVFKFYCPVCRQELSKEAIAGLKKPKDTANIICPGCNARLAVNKLQIYLLLCGVMVLFAHFISSQLYTLPVAINYAWITFGIGFLVVSLSLEKLRKIES